jgi:hypothetical protein
MVKQNHMPEELSDLSQILTVLVLRMRFLRWEEDNI